MYRLFSKSSQGVKSTVDLINEGTRLNVQGKFNEALEQFNLALDCSLLPAEELFANLGKAEALYNLNQHEASISCCDKAKMCAENEDDKIRTYVLRGKILLKYISKTVFLSDSKKNTTVETKVEQKDIASLPHLEHVTRAKELVNNKLYKEGFEYCVERLQEIFKLSILKPEDIKLAREFFFIVTSILVLSDKYKEINYFVDMCDGDNLVVCMLKALNMFIMGNYSESIKLFNDILKSSSLDVLKPFNSYIRTVMGLVYFCQDNNIKAMYQINAALKINSKDPAALSYQGFIYLEIGSSTQRLSLQAKAHVCFQSALQNCQTNYEKGLALLGRSFSDSNLDARKSFLSQAMQAIDNESILSRVEFYLIQGKILAGKKMICEAKLSFQKALELNQDYVPVQIELEKLSSSVEKPIELSRESLVL